MTIHANPKTTSTWKTAISASGMKIRAGLEKVPPGIYSVSDLQRILCGSGDAQWNTGWGTVKAQLLNLPDWHWNGKTAPGRNKWVKEPKPMSVPHKVMPHDVPEPVQKGRITLHLEHIEAMLEALCSSLGIKVAE